MFYASPDPGLFIRALSAGTTDSNSLVQRGFLEILVKNVPLSLPLLQKYSSPKARFLTQVPLVISKDFFSAPSA
jgi:Dopey, N-terminal